MFKLSSDVYKAVLLLWILFFYIYFTFVLILLSCVFLAAFNTCMITCWERADLLALLCVMFLVFLSLSLMVSRVKCGSWLFRFLIFAFTLYFQIHISGHIFAIDSVVVKVHRIQDQCAPYQLCAWKMHYHEFTRMVVSTRKSFRCNGCTIRLPCQSVRPNFKTIPFTSAYPDFCSILHMLHTVTSKLTEYERKSYVPNLKLRVIN